MKKIVVIFLCLMFSGCSVIMAGHGHADPNISEVKIGAFRPTVLGTLGSPAKTKTDSLGILDEYHLKFGDQASPGRAVGWVFLDIFTLGIWEFFGTIIEGTKGDNKDYFLLYNKENILKNIRIQD